MPITSGSVASLLPRDLPWLGELLVELSPELPAGRVGEPTPWLKGGPQHGIAVGASICPRPKQVLPVLCVPTHDGYGRELCYLNIKGKWNSLSRAVDSAGSPRAYLLSAQGFFLQEAWSRLILSSQWLSEPIAELKVRQELAEIVE